MSDRSFATATRHAAGEVSRRASLMGLAAASLAAAFSVSLTANAKKSSSKKAKQKCKKQVGQCTSLLAASCGSDPDCLATLACCTPLGNCDVTGFLACMVSPAP